MSSTIAFLTSSSIPSSQFQGIALNSTHPTSPPKRRQNHLQLNPSTTPQCALHKHSLVAGIASLTLLLTGPNQTSPLSAMASPSPSATIELNTTTQSYIPRSTYQPSTPLAIVGVGRSTIHDYNSARHSEAAPMISTNDIHAVTALSDLDDARREAALAARLITAVLLGCLIGIERRATMLNLGVRSVTITSLSAAMIAVISSCADVTGVPALFPLAAAAPIPAAMVVGIVTGLGTYLGAKSRLRPTRNMESMSWVVGLVVTMGAACGAGLSLLAGICYGAAVFVMRLGQRKEKRRMARNMITRSLNVNKSKTIGEDNGSIRNRNLEVGSSPPIDSLG